MANFDATSGSYTTRLTVTETATSTPNNTSTVTFSLTLIKNSGTGLWNNDSCSWSININGTSYSGTFTYDFRDYSSLTLKSSTTQTITHDGDGSKKIAVSASVNMDNTPYVYTMSPSGELTLTTIPRASDVSVSNYSIANTTGSLSATITSKANFYHKWRWKLGSGSWSSWTNKGLISTTSSTVTVANTTLLAQLPTATSGSFNIEVATYSDSGYSNHVGTKSATCTVSVNTSNIKPSVSLGNIGLNSSPISGYAVAGYSKVQSAWTTTNSSGATSVTTYFTVSTGSLATTSSSSTSGTVVSNVIPSNASNYTLYIYAYAKDSRGAVGTTVSKSITVYGYQPPTANLTAYRTSSSSSTSEDGAGTYAYVTFSGAVRSSVNSQNTIQSTVCTYSGSISGTATNGGHYALADTQTVTFKLTVTDKVTSSTASVTIATATYPLDLYDNGSGVTGVGLATVAVANEVKSALVVNMPNHFSMDSWSAGGTTGYAVLATLTVTESYMNQPINFTIIKRGAAYPIHVCLKLTNVDSVDPDIANFYADSYLTETVWVNKSTTSTFQIIAYHPDWEDMAITDTQIIGQTWSGITVDYTPSLLTALPSTAVAPTAWTYAKADIATLATRADNATNATNATNSTNAVNSTYLTPTQLTSENLNDIRPDSTRYYYAVGGNSVTNNPMSEMAFGLVVFRNAGGYRTQHLTSQNGEEFTRHYNSATTSWTSWKQFECWHKIWTGSLTGGNGLDLAMSAYKRIRIYASMVGGALLYNWEVDMERINAKDCAHSEPRYFDNDGWYDVCAIVSVSTSLVYFARAVNINKVSGATAEHNNTTDYQIYRIDGII